MKTIKYIFKSLLLMVILFLPFIFLIGHFDNVEEYWFVCCAIDLAVLTFAIPSKSNNKPTAPQRVDQSATPPEEEYVSFPNFWI